MTTAIIFLSGFLTASIGWGIVVLIVWHLYLSAERKYQDIRNKALKEIYNLKIKQEV